MITLKQEDNRLRLIDKRKTFAKLMQNSETFSSFAISLILLTLLPIFVHNSSNNDQESSTQSKIISDRSNSQQQNSIFNKQTRTRDLTWPHKRLNVLIDSTNSINKHEQQIILALLDQLSHRTCVQVNLLPPDRVNPFDPGSFETYVADPKLRNFLYIFKSEFGLYNKSPSIGLSSLGCMRQGRQTMVLTQHAFRHPELILRYHVLKSLGVPDLERPDKQLQKILEQELPISQRISDKVVQAEAESHENFEPAPAYFVYATGPVQKGIANSGQDGVDHALITTTPASQQVKSVKYLTEEDIAKIKQLYQCEDYQNKLSPQSLNQAVTESAAPPPSSTTTIKPTVIETEAGAEVKAGEPSETGATIKPLADNNKTCDSQTTCPAASSNEADKQQQQQQDQFVHERPMIMKLDPFHALDPVIAQADQMKLSQLQPAAAGPANQQQASYRLLDKNQANEKKFINDYSQVQDAYIPYSQPSNGNGGGSGNGFGYGYGDYKQPQPLPPAPSNNNNAANQQQQQPAGKTNDMMITFEQTPKNINDPLAALASSQVLKLCSCSCQTMTPTTNGNPTSSPSNPQTTTTTTTSGIPSSSSWPTSDPFPPHTTPPASPQTTFDPSLAPVTQQPDLPTQPASSRPPPITMLPTYPTFPTYPPYTEQPVWPTGLPPSTFWPPYNPNWTSPITSRPITPTATPWDPTITYWPPITERPTPKPTKQPTSTSKRPHTPTTPGWPTEPTANTETTDDDATSPETTPYEAATTTIGPAPPTTTTNSSTSSITTSKMPTEPTTETPFMPQPTTQNVKFHDSCDQVQWVRPNKSVYSSANIVWDVDRANQNYFVCNALIDGELIPGKTHGFGCKISLNGKALEVDQFNVLTKPENVNLAWIQKNNSGLVFNNDTSGASGGGGGGAGGSSNGKKSKKKDKNKNNNNNNNDNNNSKFDGNDGGDLSNNYESNDQTQLEPEVRRRQQQQRLQQNNNNGTTIKRRQSSHQSPVVGGFSKTDDSYVVSRCLVKDENNDIITLIGYVNRNSRNGAGLFPFDDIQIECSQYDILACVP